MAGLVCTSRTEPMNNTQNAHHNVRISLRYIKHPDIILWLFCQYVLGVKPSLKDSEIVWPADPTSLRMIYGWQKLTDYAGKASVWQLHQTVRDGRCIDAVAEFKHHASANTRIAFTASTIEDAMMLCLVYQRKRGGDAHRVVAKIPRCVLHLQEDLMGL